MRGAKRFLESIKNHDLVKGGHTFLNDPAISELLALSGYDFIWIDGEHGHFTLPDILAHITAVQGAGAAAFVRIPCNDPNIIKPVLEMGPDGIIVPLVHTPEAAEAAVSACRYPPRGIRGFGPRRAQRYGLTEQKEYFKQAETLPLVFVQIEHEHAVRNITDIIGTEGLGGIIIGPNDLSGSIGRLGQLQHPDVLELCDCVITTCRELEVPCGISIGPDNREFIQRWIDQGVHFIACGDDVSFIRSGACSTLGLL